MNTTKTIVFIHGLFMNGSSWDEWKAYFEARGYRCIAPDYPFHVGSPADLRKNIPDGLGRLQMRDVVKHFEDILTTLDEKPILIGHSIGGHLTQILADKGLAAKAICIDSAPPQGLFSFKWSFLKGNIATVNPFKGNSPFLPSVKWFQYAFCNTMTLEETQKFYDLLVVPESRNIPCSGITRQGRVDFKKSHVPLLFIAGEKDHITPSSLNKKNAKAYKDKNSIVDFKEFARRTHILCSQENWQELAEYSLNWIEQH